MCQEVFKHAHIEYTATNLVFTTAVSALLCRHTGSNSFKLLNCNLPSINNRFNYF